MGQPLRDERSFWTEDGHKVVVKYDNKGKQVSSQAFDVHGNYLGGVSGTKSRVSPRQAAQHGMRFAHDDAQRHPKAKDTRTIVAEPKGCLPLIALPFLLRLLIELAKNFKV